MMPKRWSALACVFLAACHPYAVDDDDATETPDADTTVTPDASQPPGSSDDFPAMPALAQVAKADCSNGRPVRVRYAVDGDTLDLSHTDPDTGYDERVRLIGVDTPESYGDVECYGPESSDATHALMDGVTACLTLDPAVEAQSNSTDRYGRTLAYVFFGEGYSRFLNAELLAGGYAEDYPYTNGAVFEDYFYDVEAWAKSEDVGRWSSCSNSESHY